MTRTREEVESMRVRSELLNGQCLEASDNVQTLYT